MYTFDSFTSLRDRVCGFRDSLRHRRILGLAALTLASLTFSMAPGSASASIILCRTDPIVQLSDGTVIKLQAAISDDPADVQQISYTVHAPAGTTMRQVTTTGGAFDGKEVIRFVADDQATNFDTTTVISTGARNVPVTVQTSVPSVGDGSASGQSGDSLSVHISG